MSSAHSVHRLVVVGMHRSGTSAVTGLLHAMGAHVGSYDQLTGRSTENPLGFFERRDVRDACDALLRAGDADWWKVDAFAAAQIPPDVRKSQLSTLGGIVSELDAAGLWVLKEPRISVLLPVFLEAIPEAHFVHVVRNPLEVAMSLRRRNRFPLRAGVALWEAYNTAAMRNFRPGKRIVVDYNALVADPTKTSAELMGALEDAGVAGLHAADASAIATDLYRERASAGELEGVVSEAQIMLWQELIGADRLPSKWQRSSESRRTLREFEEDYAETLKLRKRLSDLQSERKATTGALGSELLSDRFDALRDGVDQIRSDLASRDGAAASDELRALLSRTEAFAQLTESHFEQGQDQYRDISASLGAMGQLVKDLHARSETQAGTIASAEARLNETHALEMQRRIAEEQSQRAADATVEFAARAVETARVRRALDVRDESAIAIGRLSAQREEQWRVLIAKRDMLITRLRRRLEKETLAADRLGEAAVGALEQLDRVLRSRAWRSASRIAGVFGGRLLKGHANDTRAGKEIGKIAGARAARRSEKPQETLLDTGRDLERFPPPIRASRNVGRVAFYTAIAGGYDPVSEPSVVDAMADYTMFSDEPRLESFAWAVRAFDFVHAESARTARFVKTHPHLYFPDHDRVIWVDANLRIDCLVEDLVAVENEDIDIITWQHPIRDCVYQELDECVLRGKDDPAVMRDHVEKLRAGGYPEHNGLIESSVMVIRHRRPHVVAFLNEWWKLIDNGSKRDQLSFNPALSRHPDVTVGYLGAKGVEMRTDPRFFYKHHPSYAPFKPGLHDVAE